jgi:type I restriction enzyme S subunit
MRERWATYNLEDVAQIVRGSSPLEKTPPGDIPLIGTAVEWRTAEAAQVLSPSVCVPLVSSTGHGHASIKRLQFADQPFALSNMLAAVTPMPEAPVDASYLFHYLTCFKEALLVARMKGTANVSLKLGDLRDVPVRCPPLPEQHRIVDLMGAVDAYVAAADARVEAARTARTALLTDLLSTPGEDWVETTLGEIAEVVGGSTPKTGVPEYWDGDIPWITPTEVAALDGRKAVTTKRKITKAGLASSSARLLPEETVLFTSRATIGAVSLAATPMATNQGFASFICGEKVVPRFLADFLRAHKSDFVSRAGGNTFLEISRKNVKAFPIALPPLHEQHRIVDLMGAFDGEVHTSEMVAADARVLRTALLTDLLSGTNEIPASYDRFLEAA